MTLVRLIDILVRFVKVLGGRTQVSRRARTAAWFGIIVATLLVLAATGYLAVYFIELIRPIDTAAGAESPAGVVLR